MAGTSVGWHNTLVVTYNTGVLRMTLAVTPLLELIGAQAQQADQTRSISAAVISGLKGNEIMGFTAAQELGGTDQSAVRVGLELEAVAARCTSTAWVLWNHLATFHLFAGMLGPQNQAQLRDVVIRNQWVCFPAGASTGIRAEVDGDQVVLTGKAAFGSGARYAEWAGAAFVMAGEDKPSFALVSLDQSGVRIDADWNAMSLRASATDTVYYEEARVEASRVVPFHFMYRRLFRNADYQVIHARYREDWIGLSNAWLGMMAVGVVSAALDEVAMGIKDRIAIAGVKIAERPTVHVNLGHAKAKVQAARDTVLAACGEADERIAADMAPDEDDYLRQLGAATTALILCDDALRLIQRVMGGNGLREGVDFERRLRDFQAMPLHINAHQDRVSEQIGRHVLGLPTVNPF
jgi:3-hydroxy-9,10-secoandrosta-1,3,5(10)-triene-9,17-dione monooxygenase